MSHKVFIERLSQLEARLLEMSSTVERIVQMAMDFALEGEGSPQDVIELDRLIDAEEVAIEEEAIELLALHQPMAVDLRLVVTILKSNSDLERVGDHAVNISICAKRLTEYRMIAPEPELVEMSRLARDMLAQAIDAFVRRDADGGRSVCRQDDQVDALNRSMFRILITHMAEDPHTIGAAMELFLVSRNLERVADLATNVAEDVVFLVEGKSIKHGAERREEEADKADKAD